MALRVLIENPAPFKQAPRGEGRQLVDVPMEEGMENARFFVDAGVQISGFHHSDLDWYEARQMRGQEPPKRHDSLDYALTVRNALQGFRGAVIPHRVIVYEPPEVHARAFQKLAQQGVRDVVLVGKPFHTAPAGASYRNSVEQMLSYLSAQQETRALNLGVVIIPDRRDEVARLLRKYEAGSRRRLHLIGQFLDSDKPMLSFMREVSRALERGRLSPEGLAWNVGLAMFTLKNRAFYAKLLRKPALACEQRFASLPTVEARTEESVRMNLEFAQRILALGRELGFDVGFSIQPIIERNPDGTIHAGLYGAAELARQLHRLHA